MKNLLVALLVLLLSTIHSIADLPHLNAPDTHLSGYTGSVPSLDFFEKHFDGSQQLNFDCSEGCDGIAHIASGCSMMHRALVILGIPDVVALEDIQWHVKPEGLSSEEGNVLLRPPIG